ncbi:MAG: hypothetical protein WCD18_16520 [Thermosynechococcaceae cyanobacterium]
MDTLPEFMPFSVSETGEMAIPEVHSDAFGVPFAFLHNCGTWEGLARRVLAAGDVIDTHRVRVQIEIEKGQYVQTNTVRIDTPNEVTAQYFGHFEAGKLVFPLTDEVYTLGGEKATGFSGIAWAVTDDLIVYRGSRTVQGCRTHYNEIIALTTLTHRVRTTQLFEDGLYKLVTMIDENKTDG